MISINLVFGIGRLISNVEYSLIELNVNNNSVLYFSTLKDSKGKKDYFGKQKTIIKSINIKIKILNKILKKEFSHYNITELPVLSIKNLKNQVYKYKSPNSDQNKFTYDKISQMFKEINSSLQNFYAELDKSPHVFGHPNKKWKMRRSSFKHFKEIMSIYSLGYLGASVFLAGKFLEKTVEDYIILLQRANKIRYKYKEIRAWDFENRLNILKKENKITERQYIRMKLIKNERNIFAHPSSQKDLCKLNEESTATLKISLNCIQEIELKYIKLYQNFYDSDP